MVSNSSITYIYLNNKTESKTIKLLFYTYNIKRVKILHALFNHLYDNNNVITKKMKIIKN